MNLHFALREAWAKREVQVGPVEKTIANRFGGWCLSIDSFQWLVKEVRGKKYLPNIEGAFGWWIRQFHGRAGPLPLVVKFPNQIKLM